MNRRILSLFGCLFCVPFLVHAFVIHEKPTSFVSDYAQVLTTEEKNTLEVTLTELQKNTGYELAVVTIPSLDGDAIENVAQTIFTQWGIGDKEKDTGTLFLIAIEDKKMRIHTGYGVEGLLTDIGTARIHDEVVRPFFKEGQYGQGIQAGVNAIIDMLGNTSEYTVPKKNTARVPWNVVFVFGIFALQVITGLLAQSKSWWGGGVLGGVIGSVICWFFGVTFFVLLPLILFGFFVDYFVSKNPPRGGGFGNGPWFGGGFGGGGSSGGFGGFGGGSSGGGGSSSGW